jgi:hypothetical protein
VSSHRFADVLGALFDTVITGVAKRCHFVAVQQRVRLRHIRDVASGPQYSWRSRANNLGKTMGEVRPPRPNSTLGRMMFSIANVTISVHRHNFGVQMAK